MHLRSLVRIIRVDAQKLSPLVQPTTCALTIQATVLVAPIIIYPLELVMDLVL